MGTVAFKAPVGIHTMGLETISLKIVIKAIVMGTGLLTGLYKEGVMYINQSSLSTMPQS